MQSDILCSFGTTEPDVVWFAAIWDDPTPVWTSPVVNEREFLFLSGGSELQIMTTGASTLTWRLHFDTLDDYWAMLAKLTLTQTLTVPENVQSHRGTYRSIHGRGYIELPTTTLIRLDADAPNPEGEIEAVAVWRRHIDPATGLLVSS